MRNLKIELPEWFDVFSVVCARGKEALQWDLPEAWVHAELYAELKRRARSTGWVPFPTEVPYVTLYPVQLPKKTNRDWKDGNGKLNSSYYGKQNSQGNGKQKSHKDGK